MVRIISDSSTLYSTAEAREAGFALLAMTCSFWGTVCTIDISSPT